MTPPSRARLVSLDGLRGVAALIVVFHHASLMYQPFAATYLGGDVPVPGSAAWWLSHSPLKLLTAGPESVIIFFVLSGFVLTLPVLSPRPFDWMAFFPRRIVRIGVPVVASLVLAAALALLVPQIPRHGTSAWIQETSVYPVTFQSFVLNLDPLNIGHFLNNPLWSILWEMVFSMSLAVFVGLAVILKRVWPLALAAVVAVTAVGMNTTAASFHYLPAFFVGALAAVLLPRIHRLGERVSSWRLGGILWFTALVGALLLLIVTWLTPATLPPALTSALGGLQPVAALIILVCCLEWSPLSRLLSTRAFRWAGMISFSLYLVHVPIILTSYYLFRSLPLPVVAVLGALIALVVSVAFYWLVEKRAHGLSKRAGELMARAFADRDGASAPAADAPEAGTPAARGAAERVSAN